MFTTSAPTPVPSTVQELGPVGDLFLFAADAPASTPDSIQSNATTLPAEQAAPVPQWIQHPTTGAAMPAETSAPPRTGLGYYSPSGTTPAINELSHGYNGGQQSPYHQLPTQAVQVENPMQWQRPPPFPTLVNELPNMGLQDILAHLNQTETMRLDRLRQQSRSLSGASTSSHPWDSAHIVTGLGQPSQLPAQVSPAIDALVTGIHVHDPQLFRFWMPIQGPWA